MPGTGSGFTKMLVSEAEFNEPGSKTLFAALACAKACGCAAKLFESNFFLRDQAQLKKVKLI
jgi:hypothetical protein